MNYDSSMIVLYIVIFYFVDFFSLANNFFSKKIIKENVNTEMYYSGKFIRQFILKIAIVPIFFIAFSFRMDVTVYKEFLLFIDMFSCLVFFYSLFLIFNPFSKENENKDADYELNEKRIWQNIFFSFISILFTSLYLVILSF